MNHRGHQRDSGWWVLVVALLIGTIVFIVLQEVGHPPEEEKAVSLEIAHPLTGKTVKQCLVLFKGPGGEPDYRLGTKSECASQ